MNLKKLERLAEPLFCNGVIKIKGINDNNYISKIFKLLGKTICLKKMDYTYKEKITVYLKINRLTDYSLRCIQQWLNIINVLEYDYYFVCDSPLLEYYILKKCRFPNADIKFIKSNKKNIHDIVLNLSTIEWKNATYAHLTPFIHAKKNFIKKFWCIDADDTMFLLSPYQTANILYKAQAYADINSISAFSLDMWYTKTFCKHWTLGILFINDNIDFVNVFKKEDNNKWMNNYNKYTEAFNLDWYMTYLKNYKNYKIETFYVENCKFIHWGNMILNPFSAAIYYWKDGMLNHMVSKYIFNDSDLGEFKINDVIKIDIGLNGNEGDIFWKYELNVERLLTDVQQNLFHSYIKGKSNMYIDF